MISALFLERLYISEFLENDLFTLPLFGLKKSILRPCSELMCFNTKVYDKHLQGNRKRSSELIYVQEEP